MAERAAKAAERAATSARNAASKAKAFAVENRGHQLANADQLVVTTEIEEASARKRYHDAEAQARQRHKV